MLEARPRQLVLCVLIGLIAAASSLRAQSDTGRVEPLRLVGVLDAQTGNWINRAVLRDTLGNETFTTRSGIAPLNVLTPIAGFYLIEVRKEGYAPRHLRLRADTTYELMVALEPNPLGDATKLPAVVTTERRRLAEDPGTRSGFFDRCQQRSVTCLGRAELDRRSTATLDILLGAKQGVERQCARRSHGPVPNPGRLPESFDAGFLIGCLVTMRSAAGGPCTPAYFVDGFEWAPLGGTPQAQIDNSFPPSRIAGIEIYQSGRPRPMRFEIPYNDCGAVVIWTR